MSNMISGAVNSIKRTAYRVTGYTWGETTATLDILGFLFWFLFVPVYAVMHWVEYDPWTQPNITVFREWIVPVLDNPIVAIIGVAIGIRSIWHVFTTLRFFITIVAFIGIPALIIIVIFAYLIPDDETRALIGLVALPVLMWLALSGKV